MIEKNYFKVQNEFRDELYKLSGAAVKVYLVLRSSVNEDKGNKVWCGYEYIKECTHLSSASIRKAVIELVANGWIENIHVRFNSSTEYFMSEEKVKSVKTELLEEVSEKRKSGRKSMGGNSKTELQQFNNQIEVIQKIETNNTSLTKPPEQNLFNTEEIQEPSSLPSSEGQLESGKSSLSLKERYSKLDYKDRESILGEFFSFEQNLIPPELFSNTLARLGV